jgi:uroporphyrinogen decarboxylase
MRQAGRYLPEYRELRATAGGFLDLCYNPVMAAEVTLQPIRRYGFDAAILFSDILVVPHALGQKLDFKEGEGPLLEPITTASELTRLEPRRTADRFGRIYETVARVRDGLPKGTALIGFCGAPWTVATYMVAGHGTTDQAPARLWAYRDPPGFQRLIDMLTATSVEYLSGQILAGADVVQIFDTWAGALPTGQLERWVIEPTRRMVDELKRRHHQVPVIGFPKGIGVHVPHYVEETGVDGIGCDTTMPMIELKDRIGELGVVMQGNLDPLLLVAGGAEMEARVAEILVDTAGAPFIFNIGHGIVPQTPPEHVARLVELVRAGVGGAGGGA